jgi:hypothetical protein
VLRSEAVPRFVDADNVEIEAMEDSAETVLLVVVSGRPWVGFGGGATTVVAFWELTASPLVRLIASQQ